MVEASIAEDQTVEATSTEGTQVAPPKENSSPKEQAIQIVERNIPNKDGKVFVIKKVQMIFEQRWRPFDKMVLDKWLNHASRLGSPRVEPITTPFGKKCSWDKAVALMRRWTKQLKDPQLRQWEEKELEDYGRSDFVRAEFQPIIYLAKQVLYQPKFYPEFAKLEVTKEIPKFRPLTKISEVEVQADAKTANTGFPWLRRLSEAGQPVTESPVYRAVVESASKWETEVRHLRKLTRETVKSISPLIAVFERAQGQGRPIQAESKKVVFVEMRFSQPLIEAMKKILEYGSGDRSELLKRILMLISGEIQEMSLGDDCLARLKDGTLVGADASTRDASVPVQQNNLWENAVASNLSEEESKVWLATQYAATEAERVNCVAMVQNPSGWGITSGKGTTTAENTWLSIWHQQSSSRESEDAFLKDMNKFGLYRLEFHFSGAVVFLKLYVSDKRPEYIHGSIVRSTGALLQREDPVIVKRKADFMLEEESRLKAIGGNMYGHPLFEEWAKFVRENWQFRAPEEATSRRAEQYMNKSRDVEQSGEYEREGIKAFTDLVSK
jgi:hypothetical protein